MPKQFWIRRDGKCTGPFSARQVKQMAAAGMVRPDDLISADRESWRVAEKVPGLFGEPDPATASAKSTATQDDSPPRPTQVETDASPAEAPPTTPALEAAPSLSVPSAQSPGAGSAAAQETQSTGWFCKRCGKETAAVWKGFLFQTPRCSVCGSDDIEASASELAFPATPGAPSGTAARQFSCPGCSTQYTAPKVKGQPAGSQFRKTFAGFSRTRCPQCDRLTVHPLTRMSYWVYVMWFGALGTFLFRTTGWGAGWYLMLLLIPTYVLARDILLRRAVRVAARDPSGAAPGGTFSVHPRPREIGEMRGIVNWLRFALPVCLFAGGLVHGLILASVSRTISREEVTVRLVRETIPRALERYRSDFGHYPTEEEGGLAALIRMPPSGDATMRKRWLGPYLKEQPQDAWGKPIGYGLRTRGGYGPRYLLWSTGPNGREQDEDDITSLSEEEVGSLAGNAPRKSGAVTVKMRQAVVLIYMGQPEKALPLIEDALNLDPSNDTAWTTKAMIFTDQKRFQEALTCADRALEINLGCAFAMAVKCQVYYGLNRHADALTWAEKAIRADPRVDTPYLIQGIVLHGQGRLEQALAALNKGLALVADDDRFLSAKGALLFDLRRFEECLRVCDRALRRNPRRAMAWFVKGRVFLAQEKLRDAIACFEKVLECSPPKEVAAGAWGRKALVHIVLGEVEEARRCVGKIRELGLEPPKELADLLSAP